MAFVISGSPLDAYGPTSCGILRLCPTRSGRAGPPPGSCRALGGRVGKAKRGGWDIGIREVAIAATLPPWRFLDALQDLPQYAKITECHQGEVWEAPLGADVLASSDKTGVEMFCVGDHVLGIQGHPEYTGDILLSLVDRLSTSQAITVSFAEDVKRQLKATSPDREFWLNLCKTFLKAEELY
ncbi:gamma-glutamyl peptidase 3-like [Triticum urartu]|nr:gamma-glutamyl peptidase 3-like [Triticum urartu]